jgi:hypothetical protein
MVRYSLDRFAFVVRWLDPANDSSRKKGGRADVWAVWRGVARRGEASCRCCWLLLSSLLLLVGLWKIWWKNLLCKGGLIGLQGGVCLLPVCFSCGLNFLSQDRHSLGTPGTYLDLNSSDYLSFLADVAHFLLVAAVELELGRLLPRLCRGYHFLIWFNLKPSPCCAWTGIYGNISVAFC